MDESKIRDKKLSSIYKDFDIYIYDYDYHRFIKVNFIIIKFLFKKCKVGSKDC